MEEKGGVEEIYLKSGGGGGEGAFISPIRE